MNALLSTLSLLAVLAAASACGESKPADPLKQGRLNFFRHGCSACHMTRGEGGPMGPPLRNLAQHWNREQLAKHMAEPDAVSDERLRQLARRYPAPMKGVPAPEAERLLIADWLLTLQ